MQSFLCFVLRFNLYFLSMVIIRYESRSIVDKCALNRAASLLPRLLLGVELESYDKHDHIFNVHGDVPLLCKSL